MRNIVRLVVLGCAASLISAAEPATYEARWSSIAAARLELGLPADLVLPENRSRWDLAALVADGSETVRVFVDGETVRVVGGPGPAVLVDRAAGGAASRWLLPHHGVARAGSGPETSVLDVRDDTIQGRLWIERETVASGWLNLPSGPRSVTLERARIWREVEGIRGFRPHELVHRWVDPRDGVVAELRGPMAADGLSRTSASTLRWVDEVLAGSVGLRIYADEFPFDPFGRVTYGYELHRVCKDGVTPCVVDSDCNPPGDVCGATVGDVVQGEAESIWDLVCNPATPGGDDCQADFWDFSNFNATAFPEMQTTVSTNVPINAEETCSYDQCGFTRPDAVLGREDSGIDDPATTLIRTLNAVEVENRPDDVTVWVRGVVRNEGVVGAVGAGESRLCYVDDGRTEVPLWRFSGQDDGRFFMDVGDSWANDPPFSGDQSTFNHVCPEACTGFCVLYNSGCTANCGVGADQQFAGTQGNAVIGEGIVKLPSGHMFNVLLVRTVGEFCVHPFQGSPNLFTTPIRTVLYLWVSPWLGTVVRLQSNILECDTESFSTLAETDVKYGLFPPLALQVDDVGAETLSVSWDPGNETSRIDGYKVYWGTESGSTADYAFDSGANSGQVTFDTPTSATIVGLTPGVRYHITVTALSNYTDVSSGIMTTYESLRLPKTITNDPPDVPTLPIEVSAVTTAECLPTVEVEGLVLDRPAGGGVELCWNPVADCIDGYRVKGADTPDSVAAFVDLEDTSTTCTTLETDRAYFLVVGRQGGPGGPEGPLGHFAQ